MYEITITFTLLAMTNPVQLKLPNVKLEKVEMLDDYKTQNFDNRATISPLL